MNKERNVAIEQMEDYQDWLAEQMENPKFRRAYEALEPGFQVARLRMLRGLSQSELAARVGTKQPAIARLETSSRPPSLSFLRRVVEALDGCIVLQIGPREEMQCQGQ